MMQRTYSLNQAATLTGFSLGKFRYNKTRLIDAGAVITDEGWRIPHETLAALGWIGVKEAKGEVAPPSALEVAEARVKELELENAHLREELTRKPSLFGRRRK